MEQQTYSKFCPNCGAQIDVRYNVCPNCQTAQPQQNTNYGEQQQFEQQRPKDDSRWLTALLLCWFLGVFGVHRFYTGDTAIGIIQLITLGGCGIWWLVDFIMILLNTYKDSNGQTLK